MPAMSVRMPRGGGQGALRAERAGRERRAAESRRKPSPKQDHLADQLRRQIVRGRLAPGDRLPTRSELQLQYDVSSITVQRALDDLARDGFVHARGTLGTFVAQYPPHTSRYGLVFFSRPDSTEWVRFWSVLEQEAASVGAEGSCRIAVFHCTGQPRDLGVLQQLERAVLDHALAGLIFASHPYPLGRSPIVTAPGMARVAFMQGSDRSGIVTIDYDHDGFLDQACAWFKARGRRRVAVLSTPHFLADPQAQISAALADHGLETRPYWLQTVSQLSPVSARNCIHLLLNQRQEERPDALLITDDNLVEHGLAGVVAAGMRVPEDLEVVAHCNFPAQSASMLPVQRLGYDAHQALRLALHLLDAQRQGRKTPASTRIGAVFEHQLPAGTAR
jgi:DNA-binding LacI/PurR family transcriptional regulator